MTTERKPRKPATETAEQLMARIESQPIEVRLSLYDLFKAHMIAQKQAADTLSKALNGLK